jgi:very-short-patch-repair endonuclease
VTGVDRAIGQLATRQDGMVDRRGLAALGLSAAAIDYRVRTGKLLVVHRGVYAVGHAALGNRARMRAALMAAGRSAILSHRTAAFAWSIVPTLAPVVEVTVTRRGPRSRAGLVIHETRRPPERRTRAGLPVTAPLRTLADLSATRDRDRIYSEALVLKLVTEQELKEAGLLHADVAPTRSELERAFLNLIRRAGLRGPLVNTTIGQLMVDFAWPTERVVVETDGWGVHGSRAAFERDYRRTAELESIGWHVLRFTWRQLRDEPVRVIALVAQTLARRETPGGGSSAPADRR